MMIIVKGKMILMHNIPFKTSLYHIHCYTYLPIEIVERNNDSWVPNESKDWEASPYSPYTLPRIIIESLTMTPKPPNRRITCLSIIMFPMQETL